MRKLVLGLALCGLSFGAFAQGEVTIPAGAHPSAEEIGQSLLSGLNKPLENQPSAKQMLKTAKTEALNRLKLNEQAKLIEEAVKVIAETQQVLKLLAEKKTDEALKLLQKIDQQMAQLVQKYNLYRVPVDVTFVEFDGVNDLELAQRLNKAVKESVNANNFVTARQLLAVLRNEIDIQTTYMPLALYKEAVDLALNFLKQGKVKAAVYALESALGTLEVEVTIIPKPILEAQMLVTDAEKIYKTDPQGALKLLERAIYDIKLTVALGYLPNEKAAEPLLKKIETLMKAIKSNTATAETFKGVKEELQKVKTEATSHQ
jgi:tetratricopeptide (TPR) repeat protein